MSVCLSLSVFLSVSFSYTPHDTPYIQDFVFAHFTIRQTSKQTEDKAGRYMPGGKPNRHTVLPASFLFTKALCKSSFLDPLPPLKSHRMSLFRALSQAPSAPPSLVPKEPSGVPFLYQLATRNVLSIRGRSSLYCLLLLFSPRYRRDRL